MHVSVADEVLSGEQSWNPSIPLTLTVPDGGTVTNGEGGKQSFTLARFDYIPPEAMILLAECLGFGGKKYGQDNWRKIPIEENIAHAVLHLQRFRAGDQSEPHMVNAFARVCFALSQAVESGDQSRRYDHPEIAEVFQNG